MVEAYDGAVYGMDLLATAALNRSFAHISGFQTLVAQRRLLCAGALLRLQLDTAMRFYASFIVDDPHRFALDVLDGQHIRRMRDSDGNLMTDTYLKERLGDLHEWVPRVYERTSGYVHFSSVHMMSAFSPKPESDLSRLTLVGKISAENSPLPEAIYIEAVDAFCAATEILLKYAEGWVFTKANPELVAKWRREKSSEIDGDG